MVCIATLNYTSYIAGGGVSFSQQSYLHPLQLLLTGNLHNITAVNFQHLSVYSPQPLHGKNNWFSNMRKGKTKEH